jgi:hypothetical protein
MELQDPVVVGLDDPQIPVYSQERVEEGIEEVASVLGESEFLHSHIHPSSETHPEEVEIHQTVQGSPIAESQTPYKFLPVP